jgi:hypothetical protein
MHIILSMHFGPRCWVLVSLVLEELEIHRLPKLLLLIPTFLHNVRKSLTETGSELTRNFSDT